MVNQRLNRKKIAEGVHFNWILDPKFKHNRISINCIMPLDAETASENAVVPLMLRKGSKKFPDYSQLNAKLNNLYGAALSTGVSRFNRYQSVGISMGVLANQYALKGEDLAREAAELLSELFFDPNLNEGAFDAGLLELEKQYLIDRIEGEINDKRSYAIARCMEEVYGDEGVALPKYGKVETVKEITPKSAAMAWERMVATASIEIIFVGSGEYKTAMEMFSEKFKKVKRNPEGYSILKIRDIPEDVKEVTETIDGLQQAKLAMGFRIKGLETLEEQNAARLFVALYGGTPFSKLFLNVREKLSLCYYCAARLDTFNNFVMVDSGVEEENNKKAQEEILRQLKAVQQGEVSDEELRNTKLLMLNGLKSVGDMPQSLESWYLSQIIRGRNVSPEEDIQNLEKVTAEQIIEAAKGVSLDTVYFLTGKENA